MSQIKSSKLFNSVIDLLTDNQIDAVWSEILSSNEECIGCFKLIDDRLNELLTIVPQDARNSLYVIEKSVNEIVSTSNDKMYRRGFQDGINLLLEMIQGKQCNTGSKPKYMLLECESCRKDAQRIYAGSKTGMIYKLVRILNEYTDEAEADKTMDRLTAGEITENDLVRRRRNRT